MHMTMTIAVLLGAVWMMTGCASTDGARDGKGQTRAVVRSYGVSKPAAAVIGRPVSEVIAAAREAARERKIRFFDAEGREREGLRAGEAGSVSVYTSAGDGQDNYSFDAAGKVIRQHHSHGENYVKGLWTEVK